LELEEERRATSNLASNLESSVWKADETGVGFGAEKENKFDYNNIEMLYFHFVIRLWSIKQIN
jgi:hypothetical protein